jgi:hypothetical protein
MKNLSLTTVLKTLVTLVIISFWILITIDVIKSI